MRYQVYSPPSNQLLNSLKRNKRKVLYCVHSIENVFRSFNFERKKKQKHTKKAKDNQKNEQISL